MALIPPQARASPLSLARGQAFLRAGRYADAERDFRVVLQSAPTHSLALENLGILALQRQNPTEAIALLSRAASLAPERATALYNLGTAHIAAFHFQAAKECLLKAIKLRSRIRGSSQQPWQPS